MGLPGNGTIPAVFAERVRLAKKAGIQVMEMWKRDIKPRDIMTDANFRNALACDMALGCSTNSILHLPAIANEAGVSKSTVSKVLNHWTTISPATVEKVHAAIEKLHYTPNSRAVSFAKGATSNIVYLTNLEKDTAYRNPHMFDIMCGVHHTLSENNYSLTLVNTSEEHYPGEKVSEVITSGSSDGLIIHGSAINKEIANLILDAGFPHIIIGHPSFESRLCWVDTNHALAGEYAAAHMIACGYTDVAFIGERKTDYISAQRQKGFMAGMLDRGFHIPAARIGNTDSSCQHAYSVTSDMLTQPVPPRAIVCENNTLALGVIQAVKDRQLSIPDDIAILTFDVYPYSSIIDPQLTIVDINVYDTGVQAGSMMIRKLQNPELLIQSYTTLPVIIQGESTRPLT